MALNEQDREDILREATALVERIEVAWPGSPESLIVGFRRDGSASVFIGADPVFQFNSKQELRRAYVRGTLIKAERGKLVSLQKQRTSTQVRLRRTELDAVAVEALLATATEHLQTLGDQLRSGEFEVRGQVPEDQDVAARVRNWLAGLATPLVIAARPHAG